MAVETRGRFRFESANNALLATIGLKRSQFVGREVREVIPEPSCSRVLKKYREAVRTKKSVYWEETTPYPTGIRHGEVTLTPHLDDKGRVSHLIGIVHDVTDRRKMEEALQASEERYRFLADHTEDLVSLVDLKANRLYISPSYFRRTGWTQEDLTKHHWKTRVHPDDLKLVERNRNQNIRGRQTNIEYRLICRDGSIIWIESACKPIRDHRGQVTRLLSWSHDITLRKEAEFAAREGEAKFRAVFEQAAVGVSIIETATGRFLDVNRRACEIARLSRKEMLSTTYQKLCVPEDNKVDDDLMARLKAGKISHFTMEKRYRHPDGSITWFKLTVSPAWKTGEPPLQHIAVVDDISERKAMEHALRESEERYARAARATNEGLWEWNIARNTLYLSPRWKQLLGFKDDELPNDRIKAFYDRLHPDDLPRVTAAREKNMARLRPYALDVRLRMKNGDYRWFEVRGQALGDAQGQPFLMTGTMADITQRKEMESSLRESEQQLRAIFEQAALAVGTIDIDTDRFLEVNDRYCDLTGRTREQMLTGSFIEMTHPLDVEANVKLHQDLKAGRISEFSLEKRYIRPDGSISWGHVHATRISTGNGFPVRLLAIVEDITARKTTEENYRRELLFSETLANHTSAIIVLLDEQGRMLHVNDATLKMLGFQRDELFRRTPWEVGIMDEAEAIRSKERLARVLRGELNLPREAILHDKDGTPHPVELSSTLTLTPDGRPDRIIVTGTDLTERHHMQNEILKISEQEQARIGHNLHDGVGQTMTGVASLIEGLEAELSGDQQNQAARIRQLIQDAILEIRQMSHGLSPMAVKNRGIGGALKLLASTIRTNHRTACTLVVDPSIRIGDTEKETHIYRIAQEAANNALRHGRPEKIIISLKLEDPGHCLLKIEDDGGGLKKQHQGEDNGIGTRVMEYRANCIGGSLDIKSRRGKGVTVLCRFPIHPTTAASSSQRRHAHAHDDTQPGHGHGI